MKNTNEGLNLQPNHIIIIGSEDTLRHASSLEDLIGEDLKQVFEMSTPPATVWKDSHYKDNISGIVNTQKQIFIGVPKEIENRVSSLKEAKPLFNEQGMMIYKRGNRVLIDVSDSQVEIDNLIALCNLAERHELTIPEDIEKKVAMAASQNTDTNKEPQKTEDFGGLGVAAAAGVVGLGAAAFMFPVVAAALAYGAIGGIAGGIVGGAAGGAIALLFGDDGKMTKKDSKTLRYHFAVQIFYSCYLADL